MRSNPRFASVACAASLASRQSGRTDSRPSVGTCICVDGWRASRSLGSAAPRLWNMDRVCGRSLARCAPCNTLWLSWRVARAPLFPLAAPALADSNRVRRRGNCGWPGRASHAVCSAQARLRSCRCRSHLLFGRPLGSEGSGLVAKTGVKGDAGWTTLHSRLRRAHALSSPFCAVAGLRLSRTFRCPGLGELCCHRALGIVSERNSFPASIRSRHCRSWRLRSISLHGTTGIGTRLLHCGRRTTSVYARSNANPRLSPHPAHSC